MNRDAADVFKLSTRFEYHPLFPRIDKTIYMTFGLTKNETVTYISALEIESKEVIQVSGNSDSDVELFRTATAKFPRSMEILNDTTINVDSLIISLRISLWKRSNGDLANYYNMSWLFIVSLSTMLAKCAR